VELPAGRNQGCQINGLCYSINKGTKNFDAAWEFLQFLASKEGQAATAQVVIPAYEGAADEWLAAYPALDLDIFLDAVNYAYAEYPYPKNQRAIEAAFIDHISAINRDPAVNIQAELDIAQAKIIDMLK
jgi:multiple sugar transport system substrate-binding protein